MSSFNMSNFVRKQKITYEISYLFPKIIQHKFYICHAIYQFGDSCQIKQIFLHEVCDYYLNE